ncbi:DEAD-domain-containing protein [Heliocybe sulcata]|uniref:ATP-dependent RNA helicase n=1 Tax=Heliocybe sulcata TaxID=5364 RepID=A0A5C3MMG7_9AGAM|nr:DEAD-domain-containing protein [Heliocybe sulcata]
MAVETTVAASNGKTKAKQRYLKRKKERRKQKKSSSHAAGQKSGKEDEEGLSGSEDDAVEDPSQVDQAEEDVGEEKAKNDRKKKKKERKERKLSGKVADVLAEGNEEPEVEPKRPKKRRKLDSGESELVTSVDHDLPPASPVIPSRRSPTPPAALPSFPLPALPNAPSKRDLARQGLDEALVGAEVIDPATVLPVGEAGQEGDTTGLSDRMKKRLVELGITELFAVQTALLPFLLPKDSSKRALYMPYDPPRDVCVSAPTGSGKTLAYVLPIVEILSSRIVTRLRALIVLPTRDLVTQVRETFEAVGKGRGLKIGTATGHHSFAHEQAQLVAEKSPELEGGSSKVDILICTPGRLIDHLHGTPNFSLQHVRFLVIDEADRLLAQSFQDWLAQILSAIRAPPTPLSLPSPFSPYPDALAPSFLSPSIPTELDERKEPSCQKLLFSATLTSDPGKLNALGLRDAKYFVVRSSSGDEEVKDGVALEKFTMPASLREHMIVCDSAKKPLMLLHLIHHHGVRNALVFTKSAESTSRLVKLVEFFEDAWVASNPSAPKVAVRAYSSDLPPGERRSILDKFRKGEVDMLVASDLISRGIDISSVAHVVSYDVPVDMRKYVHRVGRTARAGREGDAWTLVEEQEARYFKSILKGAEHLERVKRMKVAEKDTQDLAQLYETALARLKDAYIGRGS